MLKLNKQDLKRLDEIILSLATKTKNKEKQRVKLNAKQTAIIKTTIAAAEREKFFKKVDEFTTFEYGGMHIPII